MKRFILVVDPIGKTKLELAVFLREYNVDILHVKSGEEAADRISESNEAVKLVVWSIYADSELEFGVVKRFKEQELCKDIPLIIISPYNEKRYVFKAIESGAVDYIVKPLNKELVVSKVNNIIGLRVVEKDSALYNDIYEEDDKLVLSLKDTLSISLKSARRGKYPVSILMIAMMNTADRSESKDRELLHLIMKTIRSKVRETDIVIRYGTDNFLIILPFADHKGVEVVDKKIRGQLSNSALLNNKAKGYALASSYVTFPEDGIIQDQLVSKLQSKLQTTIIFGDSGG